MIRKDVLVEMYLNKKMSMAEIAQVLSVSIRQVSYWMEKYHIKSRKISDAVYIKHNGSTDPFKIPKFILTAAILKDKRFVYGMGLGLYWGEGTKKNLSSVRLGNSDPKLINKFIEFLIKIFDIKKEKLKFGLQIFSDVDPREALVFWKKSLRIKNAKFQKPVVTKSGSIGTYREKSKYGVLTVYFNNKKLRDFIFEKVSQL